MKTSDTVFAGGRKGSTRGLFDGAPSGVETKPDPIPAGCVKCLACGCHTLPGRCEVCNTPTIRGLSV